MSRFQSCTSASTNDWCGSNIAYLAPRLKCLSERLSMNTSNSSMIFIEPYYRIRDGVIQHVRGHWRRVRGTGGSNVIPFTRTA